MPPSPARKEQLEDGQGHKLKGDSPRHTVPKSHMPGLSKQSLGDQQIELKWTDQGLLWEVRLSWLPACCPWDRQQSLARVLMLLNMVVSGCDQLCQVEKRHPTPGLFSPSRPARYLLLAMGSKREGSPYRRRFLGKEWEVPGKP